jgi:hypothetical protein
MNDYWWKMKGIELDEPVSDHTLILNILQGLSKQYDHLKTFLKAGCLVPLIP